VKRKIERFGEKELAITRGREFHIWGEATEKARLPNVFVRLWWEKRISWDEERIPRSDSRSLIRSFKYRGAKPEAAKHKRCLNTIRWITGSTGGSEQLGWWIHNDERYKLVELQSSVLAEVWRCNRWVDRRVRHCHSLVATTQRHESVER
jgi:hypothetical protein